MNISIQIILYVCIEQECIYLLMRYYNTLQEEMKNALRNPTEAFWAIAVQLKYNKIRKGDYYEK